MKKIVFVYDHLGTGGIASYLLNILSYISKYDFSVTLLVKSISADVQKSIPENVAIKYVQDVPVIKKFLLYIFRGGIPAIVSILRRDKKQVFSGKALQKLQLINAAYSGEHGEAYDIAIGLDLYWPNYYTALRINAEKKYLWAHPQYNSLKTDGKIDEQVYGKCDKLIAVSEKNAHILKQFLPGIKEKIDYIENITDNDRIIEKSKEEIMESFDENQLNIVTVCRLDNSSKRLDRVIACAKILKERNIDFIWRILGDGPDKGYVTELVKENNLWDRVILTGNKNNPYPYMAKSDVFVLLSQYEGVPIVVTEAMISGLPVIVSNYESAAVQVSPENGYIVENDDETISVCTADILEKLEKMQPKPRIEYRKDNKESYKKLDDLLEVD